MAVIKTAANLDILVDVLPGAVAGLGDLQEELKSPSV
jgi:hypothetical protein